MKLEDLKPAGTRLADVEPEFIGMPLNQWLRASSVGITRQCNEYLAMQDPSQAVLSKQRVATPRDSYGIKGI